MATAAEHVAQARENLRAYELVMAQDAIPFGWAVTMLFYAAAHLARAVCISAGHGPYTSHLGFESDFQHKAKVPNHIYKAYRYLKDESESARYDCRTFDREEVRKMRVHKLAIIETWCRSHGARLSDEITAVEPDAAKAVVGAAVKPPVENEPK